MEDLDAHTPSPYSVIDRIWPIQIETQDTGKPVKLLVKDPWYSFAQPIYDLFQKASALAGAVDVSTDFFDQLPNISEFPVKIEGLGVTVLVLRVVAYSVIWAAKRGLQLSRFELHEMGFGMSGIGWTPAGPVLYREQ